MYPLYAALRFHAMRGNLSPCPLAFGAPLWGNFAVYCSWALGFSEQLLSYRWGWNTSRSHTAIAARSAGDSAPIVAVSHLRTHHQKRSAFLRMADKYSGVVFALSLRANGLGMDTKSHQEAADIIVPVSNQYACTRNLLEDIYRYTDTPFHIYVIDNASSDETVDLQKIYTRQITIVRNHENRGWGCAINQGIRLGDSPYVVLMSNDVEVSHGWLGNMISFLDTHPRIGAVGPLDSSTNEWQSVDRVRERVVRQIPPFLTNDLHERNRILDFHFHHTGILVEGMLSFSCCVMKRRAINEVGPLSETSVGGADGEDYCRRLRKVGYVLGLSLDTYVVHRSSDPGQLKEPRTDVITCLKEKRFRHS